MKRGTPWFVYGTLRVHGGSYQYFADAEVDEPDMDASAQGHIWFARGRSSYPVAKFSSIGLNVLWNDESDTILGDVIWMDPNHPATKSMIDMEEHAGYCVAPTTAKLADGRLIPCFGFHFEGLPHPSQFIPSGDWLSEVNTPEEAFDLAEEVFFIDYEDAVYERAKDK